MKKKGKIAGYWISSRMASFFRFVEYRIIFARVNEVEIFVHTFKVKLFLK